VLHRVRRLVDDEIDLPGHQILQRRAGAAIRHELKTRAGDVLEIDAGDMGRGSCARRSRRDLAVVGLDPANEFLEVVRRDGALADHDHRIAGQERDRIEIAQQIVLQRIDCAVDDMGTPVPDAERIAVGRSARDAADADRARRPGRVLHVDGLGEGVEPPFGQVARHRVDRAAGGERHDHGNGTRRIGLRVCIGDACQRGNQYE
jgi:hypothetical protein